MSSKRVHLLCNAHLDPVWLWEWQEGAAEAVSTFRIAADLCEEFGAFIFNHNEVILYRWVEEYEPALFQRIQRLVKEGRWHIMGGWYLQPDCHMPSGESFVRQMLIGRQYFMEKFGKVPTTAINFDPFGHTRGLVQIMAKSGYDSYIFQRPGAGEMELPDHIFNWKGFDGSTIMAKRLGWGYNSPYGKAALKVENIIAEGAEGDCTLLLWGIGNHGGGPSKKDLDDLTALIAARDDFDIIHSTPEAYFAEMLDRRQDYPEVATDLRPCMIGCYTSQIRIKQKHRLLENELYSLEKMASAAVMHGLMEYPTADLKEAGRDLAMSEFHDVLPGSSIQPVEEMSIRVMDHALEIISRLKARAFFALAAGEPVAEENHIPILVYNPHPYKVKTVVECEFQPADQNWDPDFTTTPVSDSKGNLVPTQNEKEDSNLNLDWRKKVAFLADLEPGCMNRFDCKLVRVPAKPKPELAAINGLITFDNGDMQVVINTTTGFVDSYKVNGAEVLNIDAFKPIVINDNEDAWGMNVKGFRDLAGEFKLMDETAGTKFSGVTAANIPSVRVIEDGAVRTVVEAVFEYEHSAICQHYVLPKSGSAFEVRTRVHWNEKNSMLKLSVPVAGNKHEYVGQGAYGFGELPSGGLEAVAQKWVGVIRTDQDVTLTCLNDGVYASDFTSEDGLRISLLRSPAFSGHPIGDRPVVPQDRYLPRIDQGERLYRFCFNAGPRSERIAHVDREALVYNEKPMALSFFPSGSGTKPLPAAVLSGETVEITALKQAEDGNGWIVRLFEPSGSAQTVELDMPALGIKTTQSLAPFEIKTLRVDPKTKSIIETDLMEKHH